MTTYETLMARLGGQLAQGNEPIPVRVYEGQPIRVSPCTLALWAEGLNAWAEFEGQRSPMQTADIIKLLLRMSRSNELEVEA